MNGAWAEPSAGTATAGAPGYRAVDPDDEDLDLGASRDDDVDMRTDVGQGQAVPAAFPLRPAREILRAVDAVMSRSRHRVAAGSAVQRDPATCGRLG